MKELKCFYVGHINNETGAFKLATPVRPHNMALSFTQSLGEFFYDFAEKHFHYEDGDDVVFGTLMVDVEDLSEEALVAQFKEQTEMLLSSGKGEIIKRRKALEPNSDLIMERVRSDLYRSHRLLVEKSGLEKH